MRYCYCCTNAVRNFDYQDTELLKKFLDLSGRLVPQRKSGLCAKHQRQLALAVKRARFMALLPFVAA